MTESLDDRRKRMFYQAAHRGAKEADLLLGRFATVYLPTLSVEQFDLFSSLEQDF